VNSFTRKVESLGVGAVLRGVGKVQTVFIKIGEDHWVSRSMNGRLHDYHFTRPHYWEIRNEGRRK
jgi:hypothetical protein